MAASSSTKPFTFDGFAEELANTSTTYKRPADTYNAAKNAPPPPAAIGTMKNAAPRRPPPGFEKKMHESENQMPSSKQPENFEWHSRDTQEIEPSVAEQAIKVFHVHKHSTSLLDDFDHYNRMEERQYAKDRAKSYKYLNDNSGNGRRDSGISDDKRRDSRGTGRSHDRQQERPKHRDHRDGHRRERTVLDSLIIEESGPSSPIGRPGAARNLEYERDAMPSPERHGNMFEDLPGVLSKLKPDSVTKILAANGPKNQNNGGKYVPVDEQINSSQNIDKIPRKVPGQPGPNAIPIVKPKDHDSNRSGSENSTPEKKPVPRTRVESDTVEPVTSETTEKEETTVDSQSVITVEDTTKKPDGSIPEE